MYTIEKRQLASSIDSGVVEICPDGVVSADNVRIMIVPHFKAPEDADIIHIGAAQTEQISKDFFKSATEAMVQGDAAAACFSMTSDSLDLDKTIIARTPGDIDMPNWRKIAAMFKPGQKALFDLDLLIDTLQRLKKAADAKGLFVEIDSGENLMSKFTVVFSRDLPNMYALPYAYIMQCKRNEDASDDAE